MGAADALDDWILRKHARAQPRRAPVAPTSELHANLLTSKANSWLVVDPISTRKPGTTRYEQAFAKAMAASAGGGKAAQASSKWTFGALGH